MTSLCLSILLLEVLKDITYTQTVTTNLISISRSNTLTRSTYLVLTLLSLISSIEHTMSRHNEMSLLRNVQTTAKFMSTGLQSLSLFHKEIGSQHNAITDNVHLVALKYTRRNGAKHILLTLKLERMTSVRTTLEAGYHIILGG